MSYASFLTLSYANIKWETPGCQSLPYQIPVTATEKEHCFGGEDAIPPANCQPSAVSLDFLVKFKPFTISLGTVFFSQSSGACSCPAHLWEGYSTIMWNTLWLPQQLTRHLLRGIIHAQSGMVSLLGGFSPSSTLANSLFHFSALQTKCISAK